GLQYLFWVDGEASQGHCHVGDFYLSAARSGHRPQTGKSMAWRAPAWYWTPPKSAILGQRDNAIAITPIRWPARDWCSTWTCVRAISTPPSIARPVYGRCWIERPEIAGRPCCA